MSGFTSYIGGVDDDPITTEDSPPVLPDLLPGEMVISSAGSVACFLTTSGVTSGQTGALFVTTLKLSFKPHVPNISCSRRNKLLSDTDITLSSVQSIYESSGETTERKKKLALGSNITNRVDGLLIVCKNFKFFRFSFKFCGVDQGRNITNALLHHSRPKKNDLLFAFEHSLHQTPDMIHATVWRDVLAASGSAGCRISRYNENWQLCATLPQELVVPDHVTDNQLVSLAGVGQGSRPPVWVWGSRQGGSIYLQPALAVPPSVNVTALHKEFYKRDVYVLLDLDKSLPTSAQMEESFMSMLGLHCVESPEKLAELDTKYLSQLEASGWQTMVAAVLKLGSEVAEGVGMGQVVVLQEGEARSTAILVASIAQILLEEEFRTRDGLERLIQSNWVSLGFPFSRSHALSGHNGLNVNPTFLTFLDCLHQLTLQFPSSLEFTEDYLVDVWDTSLFPIFDTFIFDCEHDRARARASPDTPLQLHSAWEWHQQFSQERMAAWLNPLYGIPMRPPRRNAGEPNEASMLMNSQAVLRYPESKKFLPVLSSVAGLSVWYKLFHRSVPWLQVDGGEEEIIAARVEAKKTVIACVNSRTNGHPGNNKTR